MVAGVPTEPNVFLFGAAGGGVWRTEDAGRTWTSTFDHGAAAPVGAIAVAPSDPNIVYIGTGQPTPRYDVAGGAGVFRSTDGGKTWTSVGLAATRSIGRIWIDPTDPNTVLVAAVGHFFGPNAERGVYRSTDGGKTWAHTLAIDSDTGAVDIAADPNDAHVLFAAAWQARQYPWQSYFTPVSGPGSGIYTSTDGGVTWHKITGHGLPSGNLGRISLATARTATALRIYAEIDAPKNGGLYRSDDGGASWSLVNDEPAINGYYASHITVMPGDPDTIFTVGQSVRRCTKGGTDCTIIKGSPGGDDYHFVWVNPLHPDHIATASDQGTAITVDGGATWSSWYNQPTAQFYHVETDNRFPYWIYGGQQDSGTAAVASRTDFGQITSRDWHPVGGDERDWDIPDPHDPSIVYASGLGGNITRFDEKTGQSGNIAPYLISSYGQRQTTTKHRFVWVSPLAVSRTGPTALYLGSDVVFASYDRGDHWSIISPDLTGKTTHGKDCNAEIVAVRDAKACGYGTIWTLSSSPRHPHELWVGTDDGLIQLTRDGGKHWANVTPPDLPVWAKVAAIDISALRDGVAYAAVDNQRQDDVRPMIWATSDYGKHWRHAEGDLPRDHFVAVVRADTKRAGLLFAGTEIGTYVSFDDGTHWLPLQNGLPTAWVRDLQVHGDDLVAATQGRGFFVLDDITPLREISATMPSHAAAYLFTPETAYRVRPNNNRDTPLPPDEPTAKNPPPGAILDYWLGTDVSSVTIDIRDAHGALVQQLTSATPTPLDAEVYFAKEWVSLPKSLPTTAGMHRVTWNERWTRPQALGYDYAIGAVVGEGSIIQPEGPLALPGTYTAVLHAGTTTVRRTFVLRQDPRSTVPFSQLAASLALSQRIAPSLALARRGVGEQTAARKQLADLAKKAKAAGKTALLTRITAMQAKLTPVRGASSFGSESRMLASIETSLEGADFGPTEPQASFSALGIAHIASLWQAWSAMRDRDLPSLNKALAAAALPRVTIPSVARLPFDPPEEGIDLP